MKKSILFALCSILVLAFSAAAQDAERYSSSRLENMVNQLKGQTVDLVDATSENLNQGGSIPRTEIEAAFLAQQLDASVGFFQQLLRDGLRAANLRDSVAIISDLARRAPNYGSNGNLWRNVQSAISDINREIGGSGAGNNNGGNNNPPPASGRAFWRGFVDKEVQLILRNRNLETRTISGAAYDNVNFSFTASIPTRNVSIDVLKKRGRGEVRVLQQPSRDNDYTAVVQILDEGSGAREYELEISWR
jgi:hypothetical protein